jgi:hypothetical protein
LDDRVDEPAAEFLVDVDQMERQWLAKIPRWSESSAGPALITAPPRDEVPRPASQALGKYGELWLASQLMRSGLEHVVVAHDRLRVDCVDMLLHELRSFAIAGVVVHTSSISMRGTAQFRIRRATFFVDSQLYVVLLVCSRDGTVQQTAFLIPSADISRIATSSTNRGEPIYQCSFRLDPLAEEMRPYAIASTQLGAAIIQRLSAASSSTD